MKILKLLGIFVVVVAVLVLATVSLSSSDDEENFGEEDLVDVAEMCDEIRDKWKNAGGWSEDVYTTIRADIDQSKSMGMFSLSGYNTVNNTLHESSVNAVYNAYLDALKNKKFDENQLLRQYRGISFLKNAEKMDKDSRVVAVLTRHNLYTNIKSFINGKHEVKPEFNKETKSWESFESQQKAILSKAHSLRSNSIYLKEMTHIPGFQSGLSDASLKSKLGTGRESFYMSLSKQIIAYFKSQKATPENVDLLNRVYEEFDMQEKKVGNNELIDFMLNYQVNDGNN